MSMLDMGINGGQLIMGERLVNSAQCLRGED